MPNAHLDEIRANLLHISKASEERSRSDIEAYRLESLMHMKVLRWIADGTLAGAEAREAAALALESRKIDMPWWPS